MRLTRAGTSSTVCRDCPFPTRSGTVRLDDGPLLIPSTMNWITSCLSSAANHFLALKRRAFVTQNCLTQMENQLVVQFEASTADDSVSSSSLRPRLPGVELFLAKRSCRIDRRSAQCRQCACDTSDRQERDEGTEQHHWIMRTA
jgi:hypothetical protein